MWEELGMRREHFIFLILIVAAAVITGSTIGFASNFDVIAAHIKQPEINNLDSPVTTVDKDKDKLSFDLEVLPSLDTDLNISEKEQKQIVEMLNILGMVDNTNYNQFIKDFQTQHALPPTGSLDSKTLNLIIEQVKLTQTSRSINNTR